MKKLYFIETLAKQRQLVEEKFDDYRISVEKELGDTVDFMQVVFGSEEYEQAKWLDTEEGMKTWRDKLAGERQKRMAELKDEEKRLEAEKEHEDIKLHVLSLAELRKLSYTRPLEYIRLKREEYEAKEEKRRLEQLQKDRDAEALQRSRETEEARREAANKKKLTPEDIFKLKVLDFRKRLEDYYFVKNPSKINDGSLDKITSQFFDRQDRLNDMLTKRYGEGLLPSTLVINDTDYTDSLPPIMKPKQKTEAELRRNLAKKLIQFYKQENPEKISDGSISRVTDLFLRKQDELEEMLIQSYGRGLSFYENLSPSEVKNEVEGGQGLPRIDIQDEDGAKVDTLSPPEKSVQDKDANIGEADNSIDKDDGMKDMSSEDQLRDRLISFYKDVDPGKINDGTIDKLASMFADKPNELDDMLKQKYGGHGLQSHEESKQLNDTDNSSSDQLPSDLTREAEQVLYTRLVNFYEELEPQKLKDGSVSFNTIYNRLYCNAFNI